MEQNAPRPYSHRIELPIRRLRDRIEPLAPIDPAPEIEEGIGPQPHPDFMDVFREAPLDNGQGEAAGTRENQRTNNGELSRADMLWPAACRIIRPPARRTGYSAAGFLV
jgi:hypothetical protein